MAGGGGKNTTKTSNNSVTQENKTTTNSPAPWAAGPLQDIVAKGTEIYGDGKLNPDITGAWDQIRNIAQSGPTPLTSVTQGGLTNLSAAGGYSPYQQLAAGQLGQMAGILAGVGHQYNDLRNQLKAPSQAEQNLGQYANGSLLGGNGNQYLDPIIAKANQDAMQKVNGMYAGAGRIGGGANAMDLARAMTESENNLRYQDYDKQVQNQFNANQVMDAAKNARLGLSGSLNQQKANVIGMEGQAQNMAAGIGQQANQNMMALGAMLPMMNNLRYADADKLLGLGSAEQAAPYENLNNYLSVVRGASNGYGTSNTQGTSTTQSQGTSQAPGQSPLQQIAGVGMMAGGKGK